MEVSLSLPYSVGAGQTYPEVAVGSNVSAIVGVTDAAAIKTFTVNWGPNASTSGPSGSQQYAYREPGLYVVYATVTDRNNVLHTAPDQMIPLKVNPSGASMASGRFPQVSLVLRNSSGGVYPWIGAGASVTVNGSYSTRPANFLYLAVAPSLTSTGGVRSALSSGATWVQATYMFPSVGYFGITLVAPVAGPNGTLYQNYTWGVYVAPSATGLGCAECSSPEEASPHPDTFVNYEAYPGGAQDLDPAADYYSVGYEVGQEFDESLIAFNGTDTGQSYANFVPEVATCVPGSPQCQKLYGGDTLIDGTNVTFVIDPAAHFYDPYSGKSREVYPSDVMFSIIRAILYTQAFGVTGYYVGSDIAGPLVPYQSLEPKAVNSSWDLGPGAAALHAPYNNTPYYTLSAFAVNDSRWCPAIAMSQENGCITFHANADGKAWPALEQILGIISADGIQEAGWYTAQGADVPGFVCSATNPDAPCLLPGGVNSTNTPQYKNWVNDSLAGTSGADSPYGWDSEILAGFNYPVPVPSVAFKEVGSGPYYLAYANGSLGYALEANPYYRAPSGCAGQIGCLPLPGRYVPVVTTSWELSDSLGIQRLEVGWADAATFEAGDFPLMWNLAESGQLGVNDIPTLTTENFGFNLQIDLSCLATIDSDAPHGINIPADALSYIGLRAVLEYAYPYATAQSLLNVANGVDLANPYGGFLPSTETAFYDSNVPWPNYNNVTGQFSDPAAGTGEGTARWYWNETYNDTTGPYFDKELAGHTASTPLYIPVAGGSEPNINAAEVAWGQSVAAITSGVVQFQQFSYPPAVEWPWCGGIPSPLPIWWFDWIPDYPSPAANWADAYGTGIWGTTDSLYSTLVDGSYGGTFASGSCGHTGNTLANMTYWADYANHVIPQVCQGVALNVTTFFVDAATYGTNQSLDQQYWDLVQAVYNDLQLTIGIAQPNNVFTYAPWIDPTSINVGALIGGSGEWCYYELAGNGLYEPSL